MNVAKVTDVSRLYKLVMHRATIRCVRLHEAENHIAIINIMQTYNCKVFKLNIYLYIINIELNINSIQ